MKKKIAIAVMTVFLAGTIYAQELKFDGYLNSGLGVAVDDNEDNDAYFKVFGVDSESNGYRFRLNGSYTNEAKNAGARFRLQGQRRIDRSGYLSMPYAYGWVGFFDSKITLTGGIVDDGTWTTADWWWNDDQGEGLGLLLKAEPVKGLNLGFGVYTISQQSGGGNNILSIDNGISLPNFANAVMKPEDAKYTFNAAYTMPDAFRFGVSFRTKNRAGWRETTPPADYPYTGREEASQLVGEFRLLAVKGLTAVAIGIFDTLEDFNDAGNITLSETFGYKLENLNLGLNAVQFLYNRGSTDIDPGLLFNLWGSYAFGSIVPRLDLAYFIGGQSKTALSDKQWDRRGFTPTKNGSPDADDDLSVFSVRPSVKFNLDSRIFLEIGDMINFDSGNYDGAYADSGDAKKRSLLTNVFYVDLKFSF